MSPRNELPWQTGHRLASACRNYLGLESGAISDAKLAEALGLTEKQLRDPMAPAQKLPFGLGVRAPGNGKINFLFQREDLPSRRFQAARFLADAFLTHSGDSWLLATQTKTARQQTQRAFAIELLAPIASLCEYLNGHFSPEAIGDAYFGVSPVAAQLHLENNAPGFAEAA